MSSSLKKELVLKAQTINNLSECWNVRVKEMHKAAEENRWFIEFKILDPKEVEYYALKCREQELKFYNCIKNDIGADYYECIISWED